MSRLTLAVDSCLRNSAQSGSGWVGWAKLVLGGYAEEAFRRTLAGGAELRPGVSDTVRYAADQGITFAPSTVYGHFRRRGKTGTRHYIDDLGAIMDAASTLGVGCSQSFATERLRRAGGNAHKAIAGLRAEERRRQDRRTAPCRVVVPPREPRSRTNALAGCGCPRCQSRLAEQMQRYIARLSAGWFCAHLDREEARAMAYLELVEALDAWEGGTNFAGWFGRRFERRARKASESRLRDQQQTIPLDAPGVLADDAGGRLVSLGERVPDRSCDVVIIVLMRERLAERALEQRRLLADRGEEYMAGVRDRVAEISDRRAA
ncbi:MAG TPA: hypothetical protein VFY45_21360 [Baekduia sp.]|nr:hypothetical protein [Baekduia sp.]